MCVDKGDVTMVDMNHYVTDVTNDEYDTMYDFYVKQLDFEYVTGDYESIQNYIDILKAAGRLDEIIEGLKCGDSYVVYIKGGLTQV